MNLVARLGKVLWKPIDLRFICFLFLHIYGIILFNAFKIFSLYTLNKITWKMKILTASAWGNFKKNLFLPVAGERKKILKKKTWNVSFYPLMPLYFMLNFQENNCFRLVTKIYCFSTKVKKIDPLIKWLQPVIIRLLHCFKNTKSHTLP